MKSLMIDENGDLLISDGELQYAYGEDSNRQKIQEVIGVNQGEWTFDWEQGIQYKNITGKHITDDDVLMEIENALSQIDEDLTVSEFHTEREGRTLIVKFTALNETTGEEIPITSEF